MSGNNPSFVPVPSLTPGNPHSILQGPISRIPQSLAEPIHIPQPVPQSENSRASTPSEKYHDLYDELDEPSSAQPSSHRYGADDGSLPNRSLLTNHPPPAHTRDGLSGSHQVGQTNNTDRSGLNWIVPIEQKLPHRNTISERLKPTLDHAILEKERCARKALLTGYALNIAIGVQVLLGALTTAVSAATVGKETSIATAVLGGLATLVASYLARARGSNEPELSITRVKDMEHFIRECQAFQMDHGSKYADGNEPLNLTLEHLRRKYENLLGNADGQRKLAPPV